MSLELSFLPISLNVGNNVYFSICNSSSKEQAVFPGSKLYGIDRSLRFHLVYTFPLIKAHLFPYFYLAVIAASRHYTFVFWVSPSNLPAGALMPIKFESEKSTYALIPPKSWSTSWIEPFAISPSTLQILTTPLLSAVARRVP